MDRILITGAAGFIGAATGKGLYSSGVECLAIDNYSNSPEMSNVRIDEDDGCFSYFEHSCIDDSDLVNGGLGDFEVDAVIHLAATPGVRGSLKDPEGYYGNNLMQTAYLLELMREQGVNKLVFASTSSVYDWANAPYEPIPEDTKYIKARHPYAGSKLAAEDLCRIYHEQYGMDITILRYFTVYGPWGRPDMFPLRAVRAICDGKPLHINGDGYQERDFTYIDDVVNVNIAALDLSGFQILNVCRSLPCSLLNIVNGLEVITGNQAIVEHGEASSVDVRYTWGDNTETTLLNCHPRVGILDGLQNTVNWYMENWEALKDIDF